MPANVEVPLYFTIQPGGVYVANPTGTYTYGLAAQKGNGLSCPSQILGRPSIIITRAQN